MTTIAGSASPQSMIDSRYPESAGPLAETAAGVWVPGDPGPRPRIPPPVDAETRDAQNAAALAEADRKQALDDAMKKAAEVVAAQQAGQPAAPPRRTARKPAGKT